MTRASDDIAKAKVAAENAARARAADTPEARAAAEETRKRALADSLADTPWGKRLIQLRKEVAPLIAAQKRALVEALAAKAAAAAKAEAEARQKQREEAWRELNRRLVEEPPDQMVFIWNRKRRGRR